MSENGNPSIFDKTTNAPSGVQYCTNVYKRALGSEKTLHLLKRINYFIFFGPITVKEFNFLKSKSENLIFLSLEFKSKNLIFYLPNSIQFLTFDLKINRH
ncbi:hypothetical protein BpHYR1_033885 [Brachionus plicatilis]|uniref:Uncharacterized protein n=1 Tax=Brachionus plicatilis TaxID=10195 RepID=A0A3M7S6T6_BRAPC|nr:hypothetical protein BpHYR1_033885 [Brachionus plicatilis]